MPDSDPSRGNCIDLPTLLDALLVNGKSNRHRGLLVLAGSRQWCIARAEQVLAHPHFSSIDQCPVWLGERPPQGADRISANQLQGLLGTESQLLFIDAYDGMNADALASLSGTLVGGGLLVLLTPPLDDWPSYADPDYQRMLVPPGRVKDFQGHFLSMLVSGIRRADDCCLVQQGQPLPSYRHPPAVQSTTQAVEPPLSDGACLTTDQDLAVDAVMRVVNGHRRRPLVITADRGRGKSAALGIAAARLLQQAPRRVLVTASHFSAVSGLFEIAQKLLDQVQDEQRSPMPRIGMPRTKSRRTSNVISFGSGSIEFVAPDALLRLRPAADLLLVDEAAAIPAAMLEEMLKKYSRISFATTVHGYEGTGRGFQLRFKQTLDRLTPHWRELRLQQPIRWANDDPLERWIFDTLMLDADIDDIQIPLFKPKRCVVERLDGRALLSDRSMLGQVFALLVQAHYRTTPGDLRDLLDGLNLSLWVAREGRTVLGVLLVASEGGFDHEASEAIWSGHRRPRGHLLPQILTAQAGWLDAAGLRYSRVVRIAVHPGLQSQGVGSYLLSQYETVARAQGVDIVGSSFGATADLLMFWQHNGFRCLRLGLTRDASSGCYAALVAKPLSNPAKILVDQIADRFCRHWLSQLSHHWSALEPELILRLLQMDGMIGADCFSQQDQLDLLAFIFGNRGFDQVSGVLRRLALSLLSKSSRVDTGTEGEEITVADQAVLVNRLLLNRDWRFCVDNAGETGRKTLERRIRRILASGFRMLSLTPTVQALHSRMDATGKHDQIDHTEK